MRPLIPLAVLCCAATAHPAIAQRANENAVTNAEDAFGSSVGRESIGIYSASSVRGFSATAAGNVRIDGLYFDPVSSPSPRIRSGSTVRIGLSALGYPFPAPTGILDYALIKPAGQPTLAAYGSTDTYENVALELDGVLPISETMALAGGLSAEKTGYVNGTGGYGLGAGLTLLWRPSPGLEIQPFWNRTESFDDEFGPVYVPAGAFLPPRTERRRYDGPQNPKRRSTGHLYGTAVSLRPDDDWLLRAGLFHTRSDDKLSASNLLRDLQPDGSARQFFIVDPPGARASTSGELRVTRSFAEGPRLHLVHANVRGRDRRSRYGGSATIDLGDTIVGRPVADLAGSFAFGPQSIDEVRQWTGGLGYEARWSDVGEVSLGLQKTDYRKTVDRPDLPVKVSEAQPWLYSASAAAYLSSDLVLYAGYTRGMEESGVAPATAANRDEALPAIMTEQRDAGVRWTIASNLRLVAGAFEVKKPYFNLDDANVFTQLGDVQHRGFEVSFTGRLTPRLNVVAGGILMQPRVTGEGVALGRRPVGQPARTIQFNLDWRPPIFDGLSLNLVVDHQSKQAARRDNLLNLPAQTLVDVGARYNFTVGGNGASVRVRVNNVFDAYYFDLQGSGAYKPQSGRVASIALAVDL